MHHNHMGPAAQQRSLVDFIYLLLQVPGTKGTIGDRLKDALSGWEYTLPLEFVRKGQAFVGPSLRLRRVMNDLMAGGFNCNCPRVWAAAAMPLCQAGSNCSRSSRSSATCSFQCSNRAS